MREKVRAIYIGDVRFDAVMLFEYNKVDDMFIMLDLDDVDNSEFRYPSDAILEDDDWLLFQIEEDRKGKNEEVVKPLSKTDFRLMIER